MNVTELAHKLVTIPSHGDATAAGDFIESWLTDYTDASVTRDATGNVFARRNTAADESLALIGHHDVVDPDAQQMTDDGYLVETRDDRLFGRGAADMKGSLAAAMIAMRDTDPVEELVFASFVGEETGGVGCRAAIDDGFAPDYAVVGEGSTGYSEPGVIDIAAAHKGRRGARIVATGHSAHASEPQAGENAIYRAIDVVDTIRAVQPPETEVFGQPLKGSIAITEIDGGTAWNIIPDHCEITIDERTVPGDQVDLTSIDTRPGISLDIQQSLPPMACDDPAFAEMVRTAADDAQPGTPAEIVKPHATDAGWLASRAGTTCVVCGAAEPGQAHTATESVSLAVLDRCVDIYQAIAESSLPAET